ncbi:hypothetical protein JQV19_06095 [Sulfitobacter mediterraneus]|uniref:hypothetical protein n=2 Tax=Sulfitobacter mediterraneus TaxID=83219 RepID=UPI00193ABF3C|nr:hypothetical protein [Sulfitobacter mediterraneus]MBM1556219.1 hypothetical protein [Sulfitobacter mediterraneus]MBM1571573.1 hypothetical protein [Sulfitobacter mediterraneus]MBM1579148.1 hypothetical protein [Sulfitobacter mediterraneus]MBM1582972.1 hypothetical protein [Sulfitobacter mediterraneus]MBM1590561.1 hypothetical protein [Sulfitobacter mediterraneus]
MARLPRDNAASGIMDVWDPGTFDTELLEFLQRHTDAILSYFETDRDIFLSHDLGRGADRPILRPENPHADAYYALLEAVSELMVSRSMRAFHYTRLTDLEVMEVRQSGIELSTPATFRRRLDAVIASDGLSADTADRLYDASPFQSDQQKSRSGKFWMTSHPIEVSDAGVRPLMERWGGEVASFWINDETASEPLRKLGKARIVEIATPIGATNHAYNAGEAAVATFGRARGAIPDKSAFDLYVKKPLPPNAVLTIHTEGETAFKAVGTSYPPGFVDVDLGRWKELTGEED